jgi:hypothetical protein
MRPSFRKMSRQNLWLCFRHCRTNTNERFGDTRMNLTSPAPQHAFVSRFLKKRVFECVTASGARALINDADDPQLAERAFQFVFRATEGRRNERSRELAPKGGCNLRDFFGGAKAVEAFRQGISQRGRNLDILIGALSDL